MQFLWFVSGEQQFQNNKMYEISTTNALSINFLQNLELRKKYDQHVNKIHEISQKKIHVKQISAEQQRISDIMKKSKEISKSFREKEFLLKKFHEDRKLIESLIKIKSKPRLNSEVNRYERKQSTKRIRAFGKDDHLKQYEINQQNKKIASVIFKNTCDVEKYRKKLKHEIEDYVKLRNHLQRLKLKSHHNNEEHEPDQVKIKGKTVVAKKRVHTTEMTMLDQSQPVNQQLTNSYEKMNQTSNNRERALKTEA